MVFGVLIGRFLTFIDLAHDDNDRKDRIKHTFIISAVFLAIIVYHFFSSK